MLVENKNPVLFWSIPAADLLLKLKSTSAGLTAEEAQARLAANTGRQAQKPHSTLLLLLSQFKGLIILILIVSACLSLFLRDTVDASIILAIVLVM